MPSVAKVIDSIIKRSNIFCCLCYNTLEDSNNNIHHKITLTLDNMDENLTIYKILETLFSNEIIENILQFETICDKCLQSAIDSYTFIQNCNSNSILLRNAIEGLTNSLEYATNDETNSKTLYVMYDTENNHSKHIYDNNVVKTTKMASKKFQVLNETKIKIPIPIKIQEQTEKTTETLKMSLKDMLYDPNDKTTLRCKWCLKVFTKKWVLQNHYLKTHASKQYKCTQCPLIFCSKLFLKVHENESHTKFPCSKCGKVYNSSFSLKAHERRHNITLVCQDCGRIYRNKTTFKAHKDLNVCGRETRANPSDAKFTCDHCHKKYSQKISLRTHIQFEHGNYKAHICEWCGKKFWAQSRLKAHIVKHTKEKNFTCSICNGKFVTKEALLYHTRLHTGEKPYKCAHCNSRFLSSSRRSMHIKRYHSGACLKCDICSSTFNSRIYLEKHKRTHYSQLNVDSEIKKLPVSYVDNVMVDLKNKGNFNKDFREIPLADLKEISDVDVNNFIFIK